MIIIIIIIIIKALSDRNTLVALAEIIPAMMTVLQ